MNADAVALQCGDLLEEVVANVHGPAVGLN